MNFRGPIAQPDMDVPPPPKAKAENPTREFQGRDRDWSDKGSGDHAPSLAEPDAPGPSDAISLQSLDPPHTNDSWLGLSLEYEGLPLFEYDVKFAMEVSPTLGKDYLPSPSLLMDAKSLRDGGSVELSVPLPIAGVSINGGAGADGSRTLGLGWSVPGPKDISAGGAQIYAYTVCPDTGPCFDAGAKARAGPITAKVDIGVRTGSGFEAMAGDFGHAIIQALGLPVPVSNDDLLRYLRN